MALLLRSNLMPSYNKILKLCGSRSTTALFKYKSKSGYTSRSNEVIDYFKQSILSCLAHVIELSSDFAYFYMELLNSQTNDSC